MRALAPVLRSVLRSQADPILQRGFPMGGAVWTPTRLFAAGEQGVFLDPSDLSSMWQDSAGTTPAVVDAVVGKINDKSGRGNHFTQATTASKPILRLASGKYYLEFDGVDDFLSVAYVQAAYPLLISSSISANTTVQGGIVSVNESVSSTKAIRSFTTAGKYDAEDRNALDIISTASTTLTGARVLLGEFAGASFDLYANADAAINTANTNAFGTSANIYMGKLRAAGTFYTGFVYGAIVLARAITAAERAALKTYLGSKNGLAL